MSPKNVRSGASACFALASLLALAVPAVAGEKDELRPEVSVEQDYDTNIFNVPNGNPNLKGSPVTVIRPSLNLESNGTLGRLYLDGWLSSHTYWEEHELDGVDRGGAIGFDRTILPRLSLFGDGSYMRFAPHTDIISPASVSLSQGDTGNPSEPVIHPGELIEGSVPTVDLAQGEFGARYQLSPLSKLSLSGGPFSVDYLGNQGPARSELRNRDGWFTRLVLQRELSYLDTLSFELGANSTNTADAVGRTIPIQDPLDPHDVALNTGKDISSQQSFSIGWDRSWSELWTTHIELGVRRLESITKNAQRAVTRVGPPQGGVGSDVVPFTDFVSTDFDSTGPGLIGSLTIQRMLPRGRAQLSYVRETRTTSSLFSSNVNVDTVAASYVHHLSARAWLTFTGSYEHYATANDAPNILPATYVAGSFNPITGPSYTCSGGSLVIIGSGPDKAGQCRFNQRSALQADAWYGEARLDWQLRKRLSTFVSLRYVDRSGDVLLFGNPYDKFIAGVGFVWDYSLGL